MALDLSCALFSPFLCGNPMFLLRYCFYMDSRARAPHINDSTVPGLAMDRWRCGEVAQIGIEEELGRRADDKVFRARDFPLFEWCYSRTLTVPLRRRGIQRLRAFKYVTRTRKTRLGPFKSHPPKNQHLPPTRRPSTGWCSVEHDSLTSRIATTRKTRE